MNLAPYVPITMKIGDVDYGVSSTQAFVGPHGRVHAKEIDAIIDLATSELAKRYLNNAADGSTGTYATLLQITCSDPDLLRATADLADHINRNAKK